MVRIRSYWICLSKNYLSYVYLKLSNKVSQGLLEKCKQQSNKIMKGAHEAIIYMIFFQLTLQRFTVLVKFIFTLNVSFTQFINLHLIQQKIIICLKIKRFVLIN